jgi:3-methyladenine DNA glycosylase AlkD
MKYEDAAARLREASNPKKAADLRWFFKTGPGEYGEGDVFIGVVTPTMRRIAKDFRDLPLAEVKRLLRSSIHEERSLALMILVSQFRRGDGRKRERIFNFYMRHLKGVNNWDLVDGSAPYIAGPWLFERDKTVLYELARSPRLWDRRVAVLSTFYFIQYGQFGDALKIAGILVADREDLMHKAVGWMLREIGKRDRGVEEAFLKKHYRTMPRTMLRYAIERFPEDLRRAYMK